MNFEKDLFISYAHIDNQPLSHEEAGWVSRFHERLEAMLDMRLGQKARVWRDSKLAGNDVFGDEILSQFPKTAVLLSVVSPRYVGSDWCKREVEAFCEAAKASLGVRVGNKSRIFRIVKTPIDLQQLPDEMNDSIGLDFFQLDEHEVPLELDPSCYGREIAEKYNVKVATLAWQLSQTLKLMAEAAQQAEGAAATKPPTAAAKATVYLAECSDDQQTARDALAAELQRHGYEVLPAGPLPRDEAAYLQAVRALLQRSILAVHLIGSKYGPVPYGPSEKSVVVLQNELGVEFSRDHKLKRIIWVPDGLVPKKSEQQEFLAELQSSAEAQTGADLITSPQPEAIKGAIHATLEKLLAPPRNAISAPSEPGQILVYLICDERDRKSTLPLRQLLLQRGMDVKIPVFQGDPEEVRKQHEALLQEASAVLIFYGAGSEAWKGAVESDLRKFRAGRGHNEPVYTYLAQPESEDKLDLINLKKPRVLSGLAGFSEEAVLPFVMDVEARQSGAAGQPTGAGK
jgi:hypothetical protein